jgi:hypothetical protein
MKPILLATFGSLFSLAAVLSAAEPRVNQPAIDDVLAGRSKVARAAWWGFQANDSTHALQAAIDSGARRVIVEKMDGPWIVEPIKLAGNQELIFEKGVVVLAKQGAFHGDNDCLFSARNKANLKLTGYGATLQMRRADYAAAPYKKAEWRMGLSFCGCTNVTVCGLTLAESGGDGIYLGTGQGNAPCKNVLIKDVVCDRNYRQGISVISAENLLIDHCVLKNTAGTNPAAGIDFEPNNSTERLVHCVMRDCLIENNHGAGVAIYAPEFDGTTVPMSIRIENCVTRGSNDQSIVIDTSCGPKGPVQGTVEIVDCRFEDAGGAGIAVSNPASGVKLRFVDCTIADAAAKPRRLGPLEFSSRKDDRDDFGGIELVRLAIREKADRPLMRLNNLSGRKIRDLTGCLLVDRDGKRTEYAVDQAMVDQLLLKKSVSASPPQ